MAVRNQEAPANTTATTSVTTPTTATSTTGAERPTPGAHGNTAPIADLWPTAQAQFKRFTRAAPAAVTARNKLYFVAMMCGLWFFQLTGHPEVGWTCCSGGFVKIVEEQLVGQQPNHE